MHEHLKLLLWKVTWEILPTKWNAAERVCSHVPSEEELLCSLCGEGMETFHHLLFFCPYSRGIWSELPWQINIAGFGIGSVGDWVSKVIHPHQHIGIPLEEQLFFQLYAANAIDMLWHCRN